MRRISTAPACEVHTCRMACAASLRHWPALCIAEWRVDILPVLSSLTSQTYLVHHSPVHAPSQLDRLSAHQSLLGEQVPEHPPQQQLPSGVGTGDGEAVGVGEPSAICQQICPYAALRYPKYLTTVF